MQPTLEELEKALAVLERADAVGGRDPGGPMTVREALDIVFRATPQQLYAAGLPMEPPEEEDR